MSKTWRLDLLINNAGVDGASLFPHKYTAGPKARTGPLAPLSFSDCTDCLIRAATDPAWARKIINVGR
jgi:hypothetical protein